MTDTDEAVAEVVKLMGALPTVLDPSWQRVDLTPALAGTVQRVMPTVLRRDDQAGLFYRRRVNGVHADSGIGKSMVLAIAASQEVNAGEHVGWVDLEDPDETTIIERLRMFGVADDAIRERLHYFGPQVPFDELATAHLIADTGDCSLLVIDSLGEAFGLESLDENKDVEVGPWLRRVARVLADAGPAVVLVDHATKAADNPLHPSGSKRKRAAITGASYLLEVVRPLTRDDGGRLRLTCAKDRHGNYRRGDVAATVDLAVYPDAGVSAQVWAPIHQEPNTPAARLTLVARAAVKAAKTADEPLTRRRLEALMNVKASAVTKRAGIEQAVSAGALRTEPGPNRSLLHVYVRDLDEPAGSDQ
jgi:hypothetical protein